MSRVAVLAPHPDDEVLGCTSVLWEHDVFVVHVTDGVPASVTGGDAESQRTERDAESRAASAELGARVQQIIALGAVDQEVWFNTSDIAAAVAELIPPLDCNAIYVPAFQSGHPDHDGLYVAAQLARSRLDDARLDWTCYALYALDERGTPGYGWLHPGLYPNVTERSFSSDERERKSRALRAFTTQVGPGSVVQSWLDAPVSERFAPLPPRDAPIPLLRSYYDEVFRFGEQGIERGTVDRVLREALAGS